MRQVLDVSGLGAGDITMVEMHGTGTPLGDPIEYEAVRAVYGGRGAQDPTCWLGSVKANLGHLESAAGVASLIKALGVLRHGRLPEQINLKEINPFIELEGERFEVPAGWRRGSRPSSGTPQSAPSASAAPTRISSSPTPTPSRQSAATGGPLRIRPAGTPPRSPCCCRSRRDRARRSPTRCGNWQFMLGTWAARKFAM